MMKQQAKSFAEKAHKGQRRKNANIPYITHPIRVAERLESIHASDELICAAYLHDVVEDTPFEIEDIEQPFGPRVATSLLHTLKTNQSLGKSVSNIQLTS